MKKKKSFRVKDVLTLSFSHFAHDLYPAFLAPILPRLIEKLGINYFMVGILNLSQRIPYVLNPFIGILADKMHARYFVILAPAITTIAMGLVGLAPNFLILCILMFVQGISSAFFHVPSPVMMKKISGEKVGLGMSFYMLGGEAARSVGPLIIVGAVSAWGLEGTFRLIPFGIFASVILFLRLRKIEISKDLQTKQPSHSPLKVLWHYKNLFTGLFGFIFFRGFIKSALTLYLPTYLENKGQSFWFAGSALSIFELAGMVGVYFAGSISDKVGRKPALLFLAIGAPLAMYFFVSVNGILVFPILLLLGFFILGSGPVVLAIVNETNSGHPSLINGVFMTINFLSSSLTALIIGAISDKFGLETCFIYAPYAGATSILFISLIMKQGKISSNKEKLPQND